MIGYLGSPGALVALPYRGGLDTSSDRPVSFVRTLSGKRKALLGARARREWSVSVDLAGSRDVAGLIEVARSGGECVWYPADAVAGNLFSPQASGFEVFSPVNAADAGLVQLPDGTVARSVLHVSYRVTVGNDLEDPPVRPGEPVTVGAWGLNGLRFIGTWRDGVGAEVGSWDSGAFTSWSGWEWREFTVTAPANASAIRVQLLGGTQYARPSVAWGTKGRDRPGRGCRKAIVHGLSEALTVIGSDDSYGSAGLTITEVG